MGRGPFERVLLPFCMGGGGIELGRLRVSEMSLSKVTMDNEEDKVSIYTVRFPSTSRNGG